MKFHQNGKTLCVSDVRELGLANAEEFAAELRPALATGAENVVIDLSETRFVDCGGLGALVALRNDTRSRAGHRPVRLNLVNPTAPVRQLLHLTHFDHLLAPSAGSHTPKRARSVEITPRCARRMSHGRRRHHAFGRVVPVSRGLLETSRR
jgi:anti-anti-sigma factor